MIKISFFLDDPGLESWLLSESKSFNYEAVANDPSVDASIVVAVDDDQAERFLKEVTFLKPCIWFGAGCEEAARRGAIRVVDFEDELEPDAILLAANELYEQLEQQTISKPQPKKKVSIPRVRTNRHKEEQFVGEEEDENDLSLPVVPPTGQMRHLIAVGGFRGCGSSFVSWNLAHVLGAELLNGCGRYTLSNWTGQSVPNANGMQDVRDLHQVAIVDVGDKATHPLFQAAKKRIWVTTVDPQWQEYPKDSHVVIVNRMPAGWPMHAMEAVKRPVQLEIPELGREAWLSCCTHIPWITKQPETVKKLWRDLVEYASTAAEKQKGDDVLWHSSW